jgi:hypothetical protein
MVEYLRIVERTAVQVPVRGYRHRGTGRRVTLVGTMHFGRPGYYTGLRAVIDGLHAAGAAVLCEGTGRVPFDYSSATAEEQRVLTAWRRHGEVEARCLAELGWITQDEGLTYPPSWQVTDLSRGEIIRRVGAAAMLRTLQRGGLNLYESNDARRSRGLTTFDLAMLRLHTAGMVRYMARRARRGASCTIPPAQVLTEQRNGVALAGLDGVDRLDGLDGLDDERCDAVLVWGAGHLPGLDAGVRSRGYTCTDTTWHTVTAIPTMRAAWWQLLTGHAGALADAEPGNGAPHRQPQTPAKAGTAAAAERAEHTQTTEPGQGSPDLIDHLPVEEAMR